MITLLSGLLRPRFRLRSCAPGPHVSFSGLCHNSFRFIAGFLHRLLGMVFASTKCRERLPKCFMKAHNDSTFSCLLLTSVIEVRLFYRFGFIMSRFLPCVTKMGVRIGRYNPIEPNCPLIVVSVRLPHNDCLIMQLSNI
ncbi:hypothetical protein VNO80_21403 [Phaseolus coccineus]|uniref:Uncharacterized protein n=1 Tax=Phaseolus coccineus TaxID=3886 RepID=A0AAN9QTA2_PHACN